MYVPGVADKTCWTVNYVNRRTCALESSSVDILCEYSHPDNQQPKSKFWFKRKSSGRVQATKLTEAAGHVRYRDKKNNQHILTIYNLKKTDSAEYTFRLQRESEKCKWPDLPGVTLIVTGNSVKKRGQSNTMVGSVGFCYSQKCVLRLVKVSHIKVQEVQSCCLCSFGSLLLVVIFNRVSVCHQSLSSYLEGTF